MDKDRPWAVPTEHVIVGRRWTYAPPPRFLYEAITEDLAQWLSPQTGESVPKVSACRRPDAVLLQPWVDPAVNAVELRIRPHGYGTEIIVLAYGDVPQVPDEIRRRVRHRLGLLFGAALRVWVDDS